MSQSQIETRECLVLLTKSAVECNKRGKTRLLIVSPKWCDVMWCDVMMPNKLTFAMLLLFGKNMSWLGDSVFCIYLMEYISWWIGWRGFEDRYHAYGCESMLNVCFSVLWQFTTASSCARGSNTRFMYDGLGEPSLESLTSKLDNVWEHHEKSMMRWNVRSIKPFNVRW